MDHFPTYEEYKKWVQNLGIKSQRELDKLPRSKFPKGYPKKPYGFYKKRGTWKGWNDLCGTISYFLEDTPTIEEYKKWVQGIGIKSINELRKLPRSKFPKGYRKNPDIFYKKLGIWTSWFDLFGRESPYLEKPPTIEEYKKMGTRNRGSIKK